MLSKISNIISILKIGCNSRKLRINLKYNKTALNFVYFLYKKGFINGFYLDLNLNKQKKNIYIVVFFKYINNKPVLKRIDKISKNLKPVYKGFKSLKREYGFLGFIVVSTNLSSFFLDVKDLYLNNQGGLIICRIY